MVEDEPPAAGHDEHADRGAHEAGSGDVFVFIVVFALIAIARQAAER